MVSPALTQFGKEVRKARTAAGLTLENLSDEMYDTISRKGFISQVENGRRNLSALTIQKFAEALDLPERVTDPVLGLSLPPEDDASPQEAEAEALIAQKSEAAEKLKLSEALVIALAYKYAEGNPADFEGALAGLERALEVAAEERARDALPANTGDAVQAILQRIDDLNDAGDVAGGTAALRTALADLADRIAQEQAVQLRFFDKGIAQAVLARDVDLAVEMESQKLALDGSGFEALLQVQNRWYEQGRDKGLRFDLEVSIALAQRAEKHEAYGANNNLGSALLTLGQRESGTDRLMDAISAFRVALELCPRERAPQDWAMTQNNLGNALRTLGEREHDIDRLNEAVTAYRAALEERTRSRALLDWAATQNNLGNALLALWECQSSTSGLSQAIAAYRAALEERTRRRVPLDWAMTQNNLGTALLTLGDRERDTNRLQEAADAFHAALKEWTRDRVPMNWSTTQTNLCSVELAFFDKTNDDAHLDTARNYAELALEVFSQAGASHYIGWVNGLIAQINARRASISS